jgi:signal transduction histidine kinase
MKLIQLFYLIAAVIVGSLAFFVYSRNRFSPVNRSLARFALALSVWLTGSFVAFFSVLAESATFWYRVSYSGIVFIPSTVYDFASNMLNAPRRSFVAALCFIFSAVFAVSVWTGNVFISGVHEYAWGFYPKASVIHPVFLAGFGLIFGWTYTILLASYIKQKKDDPASVQLKRIIYVFWALLVGNFASMDFLPNYGVPLTPVGFIFMTAMVMLFAYAILRHQLLEIEVVIRRTAVFAGLFAFVYTAFSAVMIIGQTFFSDTLGWNAWAALIPTVFIVTLALRPLENFLTNATEKFLFQKKYDYRELLKTFTNEILTVLDLEKLTEQTVAGLMRIIKLESACVLMLDREARQYRLVASSGLRDKDAVFKENDTIVEYLKVTHHPILKDEEADRVQGDGRLKEDFKKLNAQLCLPISLHDDLIGILALGRKKSGEDYTQEDIDILSALARTEAIAISNARLFDELSKTQAEAAQREKMAVIGTLAAGINHEICNPLGIVRGHCELFLLNSKDGLYSNKSSEEILKTASEIMTKVIRETDRATGITKKLSSFAKPSKRTEMEEVRVEKEVDEVVGLVGHDLRLNNIDIRKDFLGNFPVILADRKQIQEVLFNIIRNAAQAIENKQGQILVSGFTDNGSAVVRISDNGTGIPQDKLNHIFSPFYTTKGPEKGTGLGLFIVKQVVERNKGAISVESEPGIGTTFTLRFPTAMAALKAGN